MRPGLRLVLPMHIDDHTLVIDPERDMVADRRIGRSILPHQLVLSSRRLHVHQCRVHLRHGSIDLNDIARLGARMLIEFHFDGELVDIDQLPGFIQLNGDRGSFLESREFRSSGLHVEILFTLRCPELDLLPIRRRIDQVSGHEVVDMGLVALAMNINDGIVFIHLHFNFFTDLESLWRDARSDRHGSPRSLHGHETGLHLRDDPAHLHVRRSAWLCAFIREAIRRSGDQHPAHNADKHHHVWHHVAAPLHISKSFGLPGALTIHIALLTVKPFNAPTGSSRRTA